MQRKGQHIRRLAVVAYVCLLLFAAVFSVEAETTGVTVVQVVVGTSPSQTLSDFVATAVSLDLRHQGIAASRSHFSGDFQSGDSASESEELSAVIDEKRPDFVLVTRLDRSGDRVGIQMDWFDASTGSRVAQVSTSGEINLSFDKTVSRALASILSKAEEDIRRTEERIAQSGGRAGSGDENTTFPNETGSSNGQNRLLDDSVHGTIQEVSYTGERFAQTSSDGFSIDPSRISGEGDAGQTVHTDGADETRRRKVLDLSTGYASFIAIGKASEYFKIGYAPAFGLSFRVRAPVGHFGIGLLSGINGFSAEGLAEESQNLLIPAAVDVRYVLDQGTALSVALHAGGGPAVLVVENDYFGRMAKVIPFAEAGIGLKLSFVHFLCATIDVGYHLYFEGSVLIMGFAPAAGLQFNL